MNGAASITLSLLKFLQDNNLGRIFAVELDQPDGDLFWQKLTLDRKGVYISDIGDNQSRGVRRSQSFELYSRGDNDADGYARLKRICDFLYDLVATAASFNLPSVEPIQRDGFNCVRITDMASPTNAGLDDSGRIIWTATGTLRW